MFSLMNPQNPTCKKATLKIATTDLVLMALFASLGLATKNVIHPLVATITGPLYVPTGAVAGGIYMMWPVLAYGLVRKIGAASMVSLIQAFISLLLPFGNFGLLSFVIYLAPGLAIDAFLLAFKTQSLLHGLLCRRGGDCQRCRNHSGRHIDFVFALGCVGVFGCGRSD